TRSGRRGGADRGRSSHGYDVPSHDHAGSVRTRHQAPGRAGVARPPRGARPAPGAGPRVAGGDRRVPGADRLAARRPGPGDAARRLRLPRPRRRLAGPPGGDRVDLDRAAAGAPRRPVPRVAPVVVVGAGEARPGRHDRGGDGQHLAGGAARRRRPGRRGGLARLHRGAVRAGGRGGLPRRDDHRGSRAVGVPAGGPPGAPGAGVSTRAVATRPAGTRRRLGVRTRRAVLVAHIASAGAWLGVDVAMAVLIGTAVTTDEAAVLGLCLQALELVSVWPLLACGLVCLATGVVLGLGSKWGLVRYWWVAIK